MCGYLRYCQLLVGFDQSDPSLINNAFLPTELLHTFSHNSLFGTNKHSMVKVNYSQVRNYYYYLSIGTLDRNEQKIVYKINNTDNELYFMLKHMGKLYTFIQIQLFKFLFSFYRVIPFFF